MRLSVQSFNLILITSILIVLTSCRKEEKLAEKYSKQDVYPYIAFQADSKWSLSNGTDTVVITSDMNKGFRLDNKNDLINLQTVFYGTISEVKNEVSISSDYYDQRGVTEVDLDVLVNGIDHYKDEFSFSVSDTSVDPVNLQMYFDDVLLQSGETYSNCAVVFLNSNNDNQHFRKLYIAPNVGVVKIKTSNGEVYELVKNESVVVSPEEIGFAS